MTTRIESAAVTGASGFVGQHLVARLIQEGVRVVAVSRHPVHCEGAEIVTLPDYGDAAVLNRTFRGIDAVFHLAARAHQKDGGDAVEKYRVANVETTVNVARACVYADVRRLVFLSSIGIYGNRTDGRPWTDTDPPKPVEMYAISKLEAEQALRLLLAAGSTDFVILRSPLVYGAGCPGNFRTMLNMIARLPIVPLGAIRSARTFIHIHNLAEALVAAASHPSASRRSFNVADGRDVSVAEVARMFAAGLGRSPNVVWNVPPALIAATALLVGKSSSYEKLSTPLQVDASGFREATGWTPSLDPRQALLETARHWFTPPKR